MRDKWVVVGAAVCAVCGVATLFVMAQQSEPASCEIASVNEPGQYVACTGIVYYVREKDGHLFVKIFDGGTIDVPFFNFTDTISVGDLLYVEGITALYHEQLEIIPKTYTVSNVLYGVCTNSRFRTIRGVFHGELDNGIHAVKGVADGDHLVIEQELPSHLFVSFQGRISSRTKGTPSAFTLCGDPRTFFSGFSEHPIRIGEVSGFGVQIGEEVTVLYYQWDELMPEPIAEAKERPEGYSVKVCGTIQSVRGSGGHIFLVIADSTGCILIPVFSTMQDELGVDAEHFYVGQTITVVGTIAVYKGAPEILPDVIT